MVFVSRYAFLPVTYEIRISDGSGDKTAAMIPDISEAWKLWDSLLDV